MFITVSRGGYPKVIRFAKILEKIIPNLKYIPRGKTSLKDLFFKSIYNGYNYFVIASSNGQVINLLFYLRKENSYYAFKEISLEPLEINFNFKASDKKRLLKKKFEFIDVEKLFSFLKIEKPLAEDLDSNLTNEENLILDNYFVLKKENLENNIFAFYFNNKYVGCKFKLINVKDF
ncbi:MAG: hypothetical protein V1824_02105 [archaeon]